MQSTTTNQRSTRVNRIALIAIVVIAAVAAGHYGLRLAQRSRWIPAPDAQASRPYRPEAIPLPPGVQPVGEGMPIGRSGHVFAQHVAEQPPGAVEEFFRTAMPEAGWKENEEVFSSPDEDGGRVLSYSNNKGNWCMITVSEGADGTVISVLHVRRLAAGSQGRGSLDKEISR